MTIGGLLLLAAIRGLDNTLAFMLNSFVAMLIGRMTKSKNGNGNK